MRHHLWEGSKPLASASMLRRTVDLPVLALLLMSSNRGYVLLDPTPELRELAGCRDPLQRLVRQALDEAILFDVSIPAMGTGALLPLGLQFGVAAGAGDVPVAASVDGPRPRVLEADDALQHVQNLLAGSVGLFG